MTLVTEISHSHVLPFPVRIGFEETVYMTSEDVGSVEICVSVKEGVVTGPITLTAYTEDGSAKRENNCF